MSSQPPTDLAELLRELEGSTHGGPRHAMLFDSIKTIVQHAPDAAMDQMDTFPTSARSVLLMIVSGLGRVMLPSMVERLTHPNQSMRRDAAMILCIWATRGLLAGIDREPIEAAVQKASLDGPMNPEVTRFIEETLSRIRT